MTKKHMIVIARALHRLNTTTFYDATMREAFQTTVVALMDVFAELNPRFDRERFCAAVYEGKIVERAGCKPRPIGGSR